MRLLFLLLLIPFLSFGQATESDIQTLIDNIGSPLTPARVKGAMTAINTGKVSIVGIYTASGTDTYAVTVGSGITNNDAGKQILVKFTNANTSSTVTLNVNGIGALPLKTNLGADPDIGGIAAGSIYLIGSTGTTWRMIGPTNEGGVPLTNWGDITGDLDDQDDLKDTLDTKARKVYKIKVVSTNYTAALGDHDNKLIIVNGGAAFEIPKDADVDFPIGATLLAADSLTTATWTKDPAVRIDTLDFTHAWTKLAANHWGFYKGAGSGGSGAYWPLGGTAQLTSPVDIDTDGNEFKLSDSNNSNDILKVSTTDGINGHYTNGSDRNSYLQLTGDAFHGEADFNSSDTLFIASFDANIASGSPAVSINVFKSDNSTDDIIESGIEGNGESTRLFANYVQNIGGVQAESEVEVHRVGNITFKTNTGANAIERIGISETGKVTMEHTNTAGGTTGNRTINKMSGTVNFAAAATTLTVTNSLCTTSSIVFAVVRTNDGTATIKNVVPGAGSFVITLGAAATAETSVGWWIIN